MTTSLGFSRNYGATESTSFRIPAFEYMILILVLIGGVRNLKLNVEYVIVVFLLRCLICSN